MFVGHTAVALAAKSQVPRVSLGWLVGSAYALDSLWPLFLLTGLERVSIAPNASPRAGLALWNSIAGTFVVEGALYLAGIVIYIRGVGGTMGVGSVVAAPDKRAGRGVAGARWRGWLLVAWAGWADRHRAATSQRR